MTSETAQCSKVKDERERYNKDLSMQQILQFIQDSNEMNQGQEMLKKGEFGGLNEKSEDESMNRNIITHPSKLDNQNIEV